MLRGYALISRQSSLLPPEAVARGECEAEAYDGEAEDEQGPSVGERERDGPEGRAEQERDRLRAPLFGEQHALKPAARRGVYDHAAEEVREQEQQRRRYEDERAQSARKVVQRRGDESAYDERAEQPYERDVSERESEG